MMGGMIRPSWKTSRARGMEPGLMPPTSEWWARLATKKAGLDLGLEGRKTGVTRVMSGRWVPPRKGSLRMTVSPGCMGTWSMAARTERGMAPRWTGRWSPWAMVWP